MTTTTLHPPWMDTAFELKGLKETPGSASNATILKWARLIDGKVATDYTSDAIAWCGLFVAFCMTDNGIIPVDEPLWALSWNTFGKKLDAPCYGAVMAFKRPGGGHVGFYVSEDTSTYHILGGNQGDCVSMTRVAKGRCVGYRWPEGMEKFMTPGRVKTAFNAAISVNEA